MSAADKYPIPTVQQIEEAVGMGAAGWDMVDPNSIIDAAIRLAAPTQGADARPFANCRYRICDLPGQCRDEGHCHHPASGERGVDARPVASEIHTVALSIFQSSLDPDTIKAAERIMDLATRDAAPSDAPKEDAKRLKQLEHALVYVAHSMHSEPQYMLAEGITLGDVSFVRVKIADIDVSVELPESVARAMYDAAMQATATKDEERRIAIAAITPREKT